MSCSNTITDEGRPHRLQSRGPRLRWFKIGQRIHCLWLEVSPSSSAAVLWTRWLRGYLCRVQRYRSGVVQMSRCCCVTDAASRRLLQSLLVSVNHHIKRGRSVQCSNVDMPNCVSCIRRLYYVLSRIMICRGRYDGTQLTYQGLVRPDNGCGSMHMSRTNRSLVSKMLESQRPSEGHQSINGDSSLHEHATLHCKHPGSCIQVRTRFVRLHLPTL